ncbi:phytochelatin synthase family protein [Myxococcota bacterium]|nr:phytochelatin synthase family protein [Myxococcota bacterium]
MTPDASLYRRPLPADLIDFSSPEGRRLLAESIRAGTAEAFFPLVAQLHTQAEPAWCGLGTLVTVLNALEIDPGRAWRGPWRWFGEELLDCCKSMELVRAEGLTLDEVACLARCNGADVDVHRANPNDLVSFRAALEASCRAPKGPFLVAGYGRGALGQTGDGHYSPLAAWHPGEDRVLILDVARFKYPPHWAPVEALWRAMGTIDKATSSPRGWLQLRRAEAMPQALDAEAEALAAKLRVCR